MLKSRSRKGFRRFYHSVSYFSQGISEVLVLDGIFKVFNPFRRFLWNIEGVQHAAIFDRFFSEGVNTVLMRGAELYMFPAFSYQIYN